MNVGLLVDYEVDVGVCWCLLDGVCVLMFVECVVVESVMLLYLWFVVKYCGVFVVGYVMEMM